jgi:hypothetical protein
MTLEEKLRAYATKGELVHLSLAFRASDGLYHCNFSAASPGGGYASGADADPVAAIERAFTASPVKSPRPGHKPHKPKKEVTAAVTEGATDSEDTTHPSAARDDDPLQPNDWTQP